MTQLHELLAVEGDLRGEAKLVKEEARIEFTKRTEHFRGTLKRLEMYDEDRKSEELEERTELTSTVKQKLDYISKALSRFWDLKLQKETSNQEAKADLVIDGQTFISNLPVTFLLSMEEELKQFRKVCEEIPTLQAGIEWKIDELVGDDVYQTVYPIVKHKTEKTIQHKVLVQPTKEHPAQVREWSEDKPVGNYITHQWCGMISSAEKSALLGRIDKMIRAFKKARQRANTQEVSKREIAKVIFRFILVQKPHIKREILDGTENEPRIELHTKE